MVPEFLAIEKIKRQWANPQKVVHYPGVKEGIYLWYYQPKPSGEFKLEKMPGERAIFIRPEPWTAQYYQGKTNFMDDLLMGLKHKYRIVVLPRGGEQKAYYQQERFSPIVVPEKSIPLADVMENCDLFIGAGGTMTREAAVLGVPTISIYQDKLLDVDRYLIDQGAMIHEANLTSEKVVRFVQDAQRCRSDSRLLEKGQEAYDLIKTSLLNSGSAKMNL
jgi:predicted glycosyltransferase